ncbi:putative serine/threonine-protein kinase [Streptomyces sp. NBRC 110611]|uniref:ATP-binding protein n=1 Tax=Streptomyces sp. NBRC 110611 TaxID=1621259 RepID=UPI00085594B4|nr:ATP-binding protein [Streptomyces sp. NBRC 110611]GAU71129.1 putative serine/threonine-protein kinase [Streptomyces sp. NBRC 110611]
MTTTTYSPFELRIEATDKSPIPTRLRSVGEADGAGHKRPEAVMTTQNQEQHPTPTTKTVPPPSLALPLRPLTRTIPGYTQTLLLIPPAVRQARGSVRTTLACWCLDVLTDDAQLAVSELVTNALRHATQPPLPGDEPIRCQLTVERPERRAVRITVADPSPRGLVQRHPDIEAETGRGLTVLSEISADWGVETLPAGKRVWALLRVGRRGVEQ